MNEPVVTTTICIAVETWEGLFRALLDAKGAHYHDVAPPLDDWRWTFPPEEYNRLRELVKEKYGPLVATPLPRSLGTMLFGIPLTVRQEAPGVTLSALVETRQARTAPP